jgi:chromosome segregation ATPase
MQERGLRDPRADGMAMVPKQQLQTLIVHMRRVVGAYKKRREHVVLLRSALQAKTDSFNAQRAKLEEARARAESAHRDLRAAEDAISSLEFSRHNLSKRVDTLREEVRSGCPDVTASN